MKANRQQKTIKRAQKRLSAQPIIASSPRGHMAFSALAAMDGIRAVLRDVFTAVKNGRRIPAASQNRMAFESAKADPFGHRARKL